MTYNNNFSWSEEIYIYDNPYGIYTTNNKLIKAIDKYGVDTIDRNKNRLIIDHIERLTIDQIDILLAYKPKLSFVNYFNEERVYWYGDYNHQKSYILKKVLESDTEYIYNTHPFYFIDHRYNNLLEYITSILDNEMLNPDNKSIIHEQHLLLSNHMNKGRTLFDLMKPLLEKTNKKRRFH